jgi:hypothetical protein
MVRQTVNVKVSSEASPAAVYAALRDGSTWPEWTTIDSFDLERPGELTDDGTPEGLGAIRIWHTGRHTLREETVELVPERRFSYVVLSGLGVKDYRADVDITPTERGCDIHWHSAFDAKVPGFGGIYRRALQKATERFVAGLVAYATKPTA